MFGVRKPSDKVKETVEGQDIKVQILLSDRPARALL
jgi:hypothetical protein